jgi:O-antigen/teichoic acid export membrane protein
VNDLAYSLSMTVLFIVLAIAGGFAMMAYKIDGDWFWAWFAFLFAGLCILWHRRKKHFKNLDE